MKWNAMFIVGLVVLTVAFGAACTGDHGRYTRNDVERAFRSQGFELTASSPRFGGEAEVVLGPQSGDPFLVLVFEDEERAADAIATLKSQTTGETLDLRRENVVVTSDEGVTRRVRKRIKDALASLNG